MSECYSCTGLVDTSPITDRCVKELECPRTEVTVHKFNSSYRNKLHRLTERDSRLAQHFAVSWSLGLLLGYLRTSSEKPNVIFIAL